MQNVRSNDLSQNKNSVMVPGCHALIKSWFYIGGYVVGMATDLSDGWGRPHCIIVEWPSSRID
ncbi:hypothetical protein [Dickeya oryzae]